VNIFLFSQLPTKNHSLDLFGPGVYEERLFLMMSEENGLEIENNPKPVSVYFIFRVTGKETVRFKYLSAGSDGQDWFNLTSQLLTSKKVRVIAANEETGVIYFDKVYKSK